MFGMVGGDPSESEVRPLAADLGVSLRNFGDRIGATSNQVCGWDGG